MLGLHKFNFIFIRRAYKNLFFLAFLALTIVTQAQDYVQSEIILPRTCEHEWVARYFNSVDENTSIEEMADFLIGLKSILQAKGYQVPLLSDLCLQLREQLLEQNIPINDEIIDAIYHEFLKREASLINSSHFRHANNADSQFNLLKIKHKKKKKGFKMSGGFAKGFVQALGGALLCIIPHPVTLSIGGGLVVNGVKEMIDHADDEPEEDIEDRIRNLPPPSNMQ